MDMTAQVNLQIIRPFDIDRDIPPILHLRAEVEAVDQEGTQVSEEALRSQLSLPGHDPAHDRWVLPSPTEPEKLAGYSLVWVHPTETVAYMNVIVHPAWRRQGAGSALLKLALERAKVLGAKQAAINANEKNLVSSAFLQKHGFQKKGAYNEMRVPADVQLPMPIWPYGYQVRTYSEVQDLDLLTQAMNRSYEGLWGHHQVSQEQMAEFLPQFNPESLFLVFSPSGKVVGVSRVDVSPERSQKNGVPTGYIDAPGIAPQHRRDDLYRALLISGIRWLRGQNQKLIEMESWGDRPTTLRLYQEMGFVVLQRSLDYRLDLE